MKSLQCIENNRLVVLRPAKFVGENYAKVAEMGVPLDQYIVDESLVHRSRLMSRSEMYCLTLKLNHIYLAHIYKVKTLKFYLLCSR